MRYRDIDRELAMVAAYKSGKTLQQIGDDYGVTRERIRQLIGRHGVKWTQGGQHVTATINDAKRAAKRDEQCLKKHGCTLAQFKLLKMLGAGKSRNCCPVGAFLRQKHTADARAIPWRLTLWQWWSIWWESGHWHERGRGRNGYCMARFGDDGAYELGNVEIIKSTKNASDARYNKPNIKREKSKQGVYLMYPGLAKPYVAKCANKSLGMFATVEDAYAARAKFLGEAHA